jgi:hypothetical protein
MEPLLDVDDSTVRLLTLKSGEVWLLRPAGGPPLLTLVPSVYLQNGRLRPRATQQVDFYPGAQCPMRHASAGRLSQNTRHPSAVISNQWT